MTINLTPEQYLMLLKMVYWSDWIVNGYKAESDKEVRELESFSQMIFSLATDFDLEGWIAYDEESNYYYPTIAMQDALNPKIAEYEEHVMRRDKFN